MKSPIIVDGLGIWDEGSDGLVDNHDVGLFNDAGTLLTSATITNASTPVASSAAGGRWLFESISPLTLDPGFYKIAGMYPAYQVSGGDFFRAGATATTIPQIEFENARLSGCCWHPETPLPAFNDGFFGPTFSATPEPASLMLLAIAFAGLGFSLRKRAH